MSETYEKAHVTIPVEHPVCGSPIPWKAIRQVDFNDLVLVPRAFYEYLVRRKFLELGHGYSQEFMRAFNYPGRSTIRDRLSAFSELFNAMTTEEQWHLIAHLIVYGTGPESARAYKPLRKAVEILPQLAKRQTRRKRA